MDELAGRDGNHRPTSGSVVSVSGPDLDGSRPSDKSNYRPRMWRRTHFSMLMGLMGLMGGNTQFLIQAAVFH